jgi:hypothetical protein
LPRQSTEGATTGTAGPVHPQPNDVSGVQTGTGIVCRGLTPVEEHLAAVKRNAYAAARTKTVWSGEKPIEPEALLLSSDAPL